MRLLVLVGALVLIVLLVRSIVTGGGRRASVDAARRTAAGEELVRDPVCDTYVPRSAAIPAAVGGGTRLFCSRACAERFQAERRSS